MKMYKLVKGEENNIVVLVDGDERLFIPMNEANRHYQEYLSWLAEGNTPEPWEAE